MEDFKHFLDFAASRRVASDHKRSTKWNGRFVAVPEVGVEVPAPFLHGFLAAHGLGRHVELCPRANAKISRGRRHLNARRHDVQHVDDDVHRGDCAVAVGGFHGDRAHARAICHEGSCERGRSTIAHRFVVDVARAGKRLLDVQCHRLSWLRPQELHVQRRGLAETQRNGVASQVCRRYGVQVVVRQGRVDVEELVVQPIDPVLVVSADAVRAVVRVVRQVETTKLHVRAGLQIRVGRLAVRASHPWVGAAAAA